MSLLIVAGIVLSACSGESSSPSSLASNTPAVTPVACDSYLPAFLNDVWPILQGQCYSCHGVNAANVTSDFNLVNSQVAATDFNEINFSEFKAIAGKTDNANLSWMLSKPTNINNVNHGGGQVFAVNSSQYATFQDMVAKLANCSNTVVNTAGVIQNTDYQRLRKATLSLSGRLPTLAEENNLITAGNDTVAIQASLDAAVDQLMTEAVFYERLKEIFNDLLLLDAFPTTQLLNPFRLSNFANGDYFSRANLDTQYTPQLRDTIRLYANKGIADAPLELIAHVVKNNRPFTEILTANYTLVNPYSAKIFNDTSNGIGFQFQYGDGLNGSQLPSQNDFREAVIVDKNSKTYPHAGILSTLTYLTRYLSTNTNRNRARSRVTFSYFLGVDVQGLADRAGLNLDNIIGTEPTLEDPQCTACHTTIDPLAGLFKNWANNGQFRGDYLSWFKPNRMLQPGYSDTLLLPSARSGTALQWLAEQITKDKRFATTVVNTVFKGLTGQILPSNTAEDTLFEETLTTNFVNSNFEIRVLIKEIINSLYFTSKNLGDAEIATDFNQLGMAHLLTPEQLHRKILAVTGDYSWRSPTSINRNLNDRNTYRLLYGGIDSISVTERTTDPTALINGIQQRIALQVACQAVPLDFKKSISQRALFPLVEITDLSSSGSGQIKIKQNIKHLYKQILGEQYSLSNSEIDRAYNLFVNVNTVLLPSAGAIPVDCSAGLTTNVDAAINNDKDKTVQSWMAVVAFLLSDYQFFYE